MTPHGCPRARCRAFSLVELLAVVGIIALLISILIPSLSTARLEANRGASKAFLGSVERGVEMFHVDYGSYPDSRMRRDPINNNLPSDWRSNAELSGAHWLARAMVGHDGLGLDFGGRSMGDGAKGSFDYDAFVKNSSDPSRSGPYAQRRGVYIDEKSREVYLSDRNEKLMQNGGPETGRSVLIDTFNYPILYYKANPRAQYPFSVDGRGTKAPDGRATDDALGIYNHEDNFRLTGRKETSTNPWDFAGGGSNKMHGLRMVGDLQDISNLHQKPGANYRGETFANYLHHEGAHDAADSVKPVKAEGYVLISAGPDGIYGTTDDVSNFK